MHVDPRDAVVMVVEDNPDNLFIVIDLLRSDVQVKHCNGRASGRQLFKLLETSPNVQPDLILLDLQLPYEDGYSVLKQIKQTPMLRSTKVVAVTANVMPQDVERVREAGFDGFIGKPIDIDRFPRQITDILSGKAVWEPR